MKQTKLLIDYLNYIEILLTYITQKDGRKYYYMITKHYCKECFKALYGKTVSDKLLLMSKENGFCQCCEKTKNPVVIDYFKYGEHQVTSDGKRIVGTSKHIGVNPNYTFFGKEPFYKEEG